MRDRKSLGLRVRAAFATLLLVSPAVSGDPVHKFQKRDGYWHHGSGWLFPASIAGFELGGPPHQIAGNDDVGAEYVMESNGSRRTAIVDVYYPSSTEVFAKLDSATAALEARAPDDACRIERPRQASVEVGTDAIAGVKVSFGASPAKGCSRHSFYLFATSGWIISVRTSAPAADPGAEKALDDFVRGLPWASLGTDPFVNELVP